MPINDPSDRVRLDKWLWAARFFKTRALATQAVTGGKVRVNNEHAKPGRAVRCGDQLQIRRKGESCTVIIAGLSSRRGPATAAQKLYAETTESIEQRARLREERRLRITQSPRPGRRPNKKDRRDLIRIRRGS